MFTSIYILFSLLFCFFDIVGSWTRECIRVHDLFVVILFCCVFSFMFNFSLFFFFCVSFCNFFVHSFHPLTFTDRLPQFPFFQSYFHYFLFFPLFFFLRYSLIPPFHLSRSLLLLSTFVHSVIIYTVSFSLFTFVTCN